MTWLLALALGAAPTVVAPEWVGVNVKREMVSLYAGTLAESLRAQGLKVTSAEDIGAVLGLERQRQLAGCNDQSASCLVELANALGADASLQVNLARLDDGSFRGLARLIGSRNSETLSSVKLDAPGERALLDALEAAGPVLARPLVGAAPGARGPKRPWWLPGAAGVVAVGIGAGLLVGARVTFDGLAAQPSHDDATAAARSGSGLQTGGFIALGVAGVALVVAVVLLLWPGSSAGGAP